MSQTNQDPEIGSPPGLPRWVKLLALGALVVILLLIIVALALGGEHGPGQHNPTGALQFALSQL